MADESNVIPPSRLARWIFLALLIAGGVILYFRDGVPLAAFGSRPPAAATDSSH